MFELPFLMSLKFGWFCKLFDIFIDAVGCAREQKYNNIQYIFLQFRKVVTLSLSSFAQILISGLVPLDPLHS